MIKLLSSFSKPSLLTLAALTLALGLQALRAQTQCPAMNATMEGTYVMSGSGTIVGVGAIASVGVVTYDGQGNGLGTSTTVVNGATSRGTVPGTFTVNRDCTGSKTFGSGPSATHFDFVITPDGSKITWIVTDPGVIMTGTATRMR
ncbi:MAG TPA: hypothetical protein VNX18_05085 [Bryobacteraceae bacterium]|nr:hypothetical protein [Bryobacteraceae bacterium]